MADFCSLCGYGDINITEIYNTHLKPNIEKDIKNMKDDEISSVTIGGICEHCGIVRIGVNNKYEVWGGYYGANNHKIGHIDKETMELSLLEDDPKYNDKRKENISELANLKLELALTDLYCIKNNKLQSELVDEDCEKIYKLLKECINLI